MAELSVVLLLHAFLCASATAVSGYALYVGHSNGRDQDYEAMCDLGPQMSCSSVLTSRYSRGFGLLGDLLGDDHPLNVNNAVFGIAFYIGVALLGFLGSKPVTLLVLTGELVGAADFLYLAYIMAFVLNELCLVCISLYSLHFCLILLHLYQYCHMGDTKLNKKQE